MAYELLGGNPLGLYKQCGRACAVAMDIIVVLARGLTDSKHCCDRRDHSDRGRARKRTENEAKCVLVSYTCPPRAARARGEKQSLVHELMGESSVERYRQCLSTGVRCGGKYSTHLYKPEVAKCQALAAKRGALDKHPTLQKRQHNKKKRIKKSTVPRPWCREAR